jgi:PAS domain S-box-containing protein
VSRKPPDAPPAAPPGDTGFGTVQDWAPFVGTEDATQLLAGLGALGGSHELLDQLTAAVMPAGPAAAGASAVAGPPADAAFRALVEHLPCVAFIADMGGGPSRVYVNPYIEHLLGYTREEWLRDPFLWYWRVHADDRAAWNEEFARGLVHGGPWQADCRFLAADGRAVWVRGHARIVRDDGGRPLYLQGIAFEIGSLKQAELAARRELDRAAGALDALPEALVAVAADGSVTPLNAAARRRLGVTPPATLADLAAALGAPGLEAAVARCRAEGAALEAGAAAPLRIRCLAPAEGAGEAAPVVLRLE